MVDWKRSVLALLAAVVAVTLQGSLAQNCTPLSEDEMKPRWIEEVLKGLPADHFSFLTAKPFLELSLNRSEVDLTSPHQCPQGALTCDPISDPGCVQCQPARDVPEPIPDSPSLDLTADIRHRSACPWLYEETYTGRMRYPSTLVEAKCNCEASCQCLLPTDDGVCEAVYVYIPLLLNTEKADYNGTCVYDIEMYKLQVGCTCVRIPEV